MCGRDSRYLVPICQPRSHLLSSIDFSVILQFPPASPPLGAVCSGPPISDSPCLTSRVLYQNQLQLSGQAVALPAVLRHRRACGSSWPTRSTSLKKSPPAGSTSRYASIRPLQPSVFLTNRCRHFTTRTVSIMAQPTLQRRISSIKITASSTPASSTSPQRKQRPSILSSA